MDLPYRAEYAKSSRASCRGCKSTIEKDTVRLAVMVQSPMFDGKTPNWYHEKCFFGKQRPTTVDDIANFEVLRWDDQQKIKSQIGTATSAVLPTKKGKKRNATTIAANQANLKDFIIEYSKSSKAGCRGCEQKIMKEEIRISKKDFESDVGKRYGGQDRWHHVSCFAQLRSELGYFECADQLPGYKSLSKQDQLEVKKQLPAVKQAEIPEKKPKLEDSIGSINKSDENKMRLQNKMIFSWRDQLKCLSKVQLQVLLEQNNQKVPTGVDVMLDCVSDALVFGALKNCTECKDGQLVLDKLGYRCQGNLTEWTKCDFVTKDPQRCSFVISPEFKQAFDFFKKYKYVKRKRFIKDVKPTIDASVIKKEEQADTKPKVERATPLLYNMEFVILGKASPDKNELKKKIIKMGGKVSTKIGDKIMAVVSTPEDVKKMGARIVEAQNADIQVVPMDFLDKAEQYAGRIPELITKKSICNWGSDPHTRLPPTSTPNKSKSGSMFQKSGPSKISMKLKSGGAVDPDSGLEDRAHIYKSGNDKYTVVLGLTDIQSKVNKFYKMQLLQSDGGASYWLFRAWGRIGTSIGGHKLQPQPSEEEAKLEFTSLYQKMTGNSWEDRHNFVKVAGCYYPVDVDHGDDVEDKLSVEISDDVDNSTLDKPIQEVVKLIFDVNVMKKVMMEFELDTEKMPLGKLSKKQLEKAYTVLTELQNLVEKGGSKARFIDASNRFYTLVPHSFGTDNPPIINDLDTIKKKIEMVENLMEMEIAYNLMNTQNDGGKSRIDAYYEQLKTELKVLDKKSKEFLIIKEYVANTHAATHSNYELEIEEVFSVKRHGEEDRYKPFKKFKNRKLLWHGSRRTNYAGILSQGLRIAPPQAPVTGYMFGKGIYFADMVSKSANYCYTSAGNNIGLMLLCEVALGEIDELHWAYDPSPLPAGIHSVKGVGATEPNPKTFKKILGDVHVPLGKGMPSATANSSILLYNEYIVYDVAQANIKYLLKMNFKYKY